jgi:methionine synthase II (cobalamin-independent)
MTMPSATQFPAIAFKKGVTDRVYADYSDLLRDITAIVRDEMQQLAARKVDYIQIDAPRYSYYLDPKWREWMQHEMGLDPEATLDEALAADNQCFQAAPRRHPRHPSLSRQQPQPLVRPGRLRCHRRKALLHPRRRPLLTRRIDAASKYILLEHLALSPQCGFASTMEGNLLTEDEQWAKLRLVAETARKIWA